MRRPRRKTIEAVINWMAAIDARPYGPNMTPENGLEWFGFMDYSVDDLIARHDHIRNGTLVPADKNPALAEQFGRLPRRLRGPDKKKRKTGNQKGRPKGAKDKKPRKRRPSND